MKTYKKAAKIKTNKMNHCSSNGAKEKYPTKLPSQAQERSVFATIDENFGFLNSIFGNGIGLVEGKYDVLEGKVQAGVAYISSISDRELISSKIIKPLLEGKLDFNFNSQDIPHLIQSRFIAVPKIKQSDQMTQIVEGLFNGDTVLFINDLNTALIIGSRLLKERSIEKPDNEVTVHGSMDSFTEDLETNRSLIIRRLPTPNLHFETFTLGVLSHTTVQLLWIEGIANPKAVVEARRRINNVDIDIIHGIGFLAELIEDKPLSVFPKYITTQRPDVISKYLADGHFAVICSNSPFGLVAPISFWDNFKTMDDYSERFLVSSFLRLIRYLAFIVSITVSPLYLSFATYNHSIVPPTLALNIATGRAGVPFPTVVELLVMTLSMSIIREAALRIPGSVGYFVGALAAVVIGQATVTAGYVSASLIIVVAIATISSFAIGATSLIYPAKLINYFFIILAGVFGTFGLINGIVIVFWHLISLESFAVPYLYPLVPFDFEGMKDTFIRAPFSIMKKRLRLLAPFNRNRMNTIKHEEE